MRSIINSIFKPKLEEGWLSVVFSPEEVCFAHVKRVPKGKPEVTLFQVHKQVDMANPSALEKLGKTMKANRFHCTTVLEHVEYQMLLVEAPGVAAEELKSAIRWRIKDLLSYHVDDATIDVLEIPAEKNASVVRNRAMYAVAAQNDVIRRHVLQFQQAQIPLSVIDLPEIAQRNIASLLEAGEGSIAILSFDSEGGLLTFSSAGALYLTRRIEVSLPQLLQSSGETQAHYFDRITLELQRSLDHFERQFHYIPLSRLILAPLPEPVGLQAYLATNLYLPVEELDLGTVFDLSKVPDLTKPYLQWQHFYTLGAALRVEEKVL